jgi:hypothetical protein
MTNTLHKPDLHDLEQSFEAPPIEPEGRNAGPRINSDDSDGFNEASSGFYGPDSPQGPASAEFGGINRPRRSGNNSIAPDYGEMFAGGDNNNDKPDLAEVKSGLGSDRTGLNNGGFYGSNQEIGNQELSSLRPNLKSKKKSGKVFGYAVGLIIAAVISGLGSVIFMIPNAVMSWIDGKVDAVTNHMVDKATDRVAHTYMKRVMAPRAKACGFTVNITCSTRVDGDGPVRTLLRTMQQSSTDDLLAKKGIFMSYDKRANGGAGSYKILTPNNPAGFDLTDIGENTFDFDRFNKQDIGPREAFKSIRKELSVAFEGETKIKKYMKVRYHLGVLKEKYSLKKCRIFCTEKDRVERKIVDNKLVNRVRVARIKAISKFNAKTSLLMECLMQGCVDDMGNLDEDNSTIKKALEDIGDGDPEHPKFKAFMSELEYAEKRGLKGLSGVLKAKRNLFVKKIFTTLLEKLGVQGAEAITSEIGTVAAQGVPIVGQILLVIMVVDLFSKAEDALSKDGGFVRNIDKIKISNMIEEYSRFSQVISESHYGALSMAEYGEIFQSLPSIGKSRFFQGAILGKPVDEVNKYQQDCPNSGRIVDGDSICQEFKLKYQPAIIQAYNNSPIASVIDGGLSFYRSGDLLLMGLPNPFGSVIKKGECSGFSVCVIYRTVNEAIGWAFEKAIDFIPGATTVVEWFSEKISGLMEKLGISDLLMDMIKKLSPMADCTEINSPDHPSCIVGGEFSLADSVREVSFKAPEISEDSYIKQYGISMKSQEEDFKMLSFKDRLLNFNNSRSLVASLFKKTYFDQDMVMLALNPYSQLNLAFEGVKNNPNINTEAYADAEADAEAKIAYEAKLVNQYNSGVHLYTDGVIDSATDEDIENCGKEGTEQHITCPLYSGVTELAASNYVTNGSGGGQNYSSIGDLETPPNLETIKLDGGTTYYKMPEDSEGRYTIYSDPVQRYGSLELVSLIYTVAKKYNEIMGGKSKIDIGDLNASGHKSHKWGVGVDLDAKGEIAAADSTEARGGEYSTEATITLGKLFIDSGMIKNIWWCGQGNSVGDTGGGDGTISALRSYAESKGYAVNIKCLTNHYNHFHIDIKDEFRGEEYTP